MNNAEALTRPDAWKSIPWAGKYRVRRLVNGGVQWHRGRPRKYAMHGRIITFTRHDHADARAVRLNIDDAKASQIAEAKAAADELTALSQEMRLP